jgi:hypothetical protein
MRLSARTSALLAVAVAAFLAVGCGETVIDDVKTEGAIQHNLETSLDEKVSKVDCPAGVEVEAGKTFDCAVTLEGGKRQTAKLKVLNEDADVELVDLSGDK